MPDVAVESGKLVVVPCTRRFRGPMMEFCMHLSCDRPWNVYAAVDMDRKVITSLRLSSRRAACAAHDVLLLRCSTACRYVFVGDPTFIYAKHGKPLEAMQAFRASRRTLGGIYTTESGALAFAMKIGCKGGRLTASTADDDIILMPLAREEDLLDEPQ